MSISISEGSGTCASEEADTTSTPRRMRSAVWEHYEKDLVDVDGELKAVCKYCHLKLVTKSGTSSLRSHIANACPAIDSAIRKGFQASMIKQSIDKIFVFDAQLCRERMIDFIIHAEIAFLKFEDPYLQPWIDSMQPAFKVKGRQTIRNDCWKKYEEMKKVFLKVQLTNLYYFLRVQMTNLYFLPFFLQTVCEDNRGHHNLTA